MEKRETTVAEAQYQEPIRKVREEGHETLGFMTTWAFRDDPKRLAFTFARYKFVAKMFAGYDDVLEVGCGDAFVSRVVRQEVGRLTGIDIDPSFIADAQARTSTQWPITVLQHNIVEAPMDRAFDGIYSLDVMEHIPQELEDRYLSHICQSLKPFGTLIVGMPSLESQAYASPQSRAGHVNCKSQNDLRSILGRYFNNVFMFSMNDEVLHTGYGKMAHYHMALCCCKK